MNKIICIKVLLVKKYIYADYSALSEEIKTNPKAPQFKADDRVRIIKYNLFF